MKDGIFLSIAALEGYADVVDEDGLPEFDTPFQAEIAGYLDDTYKEAIQDCITILKTVLDKQPRGV